MALKYICLAIAALATLVIAKDVGLGESKVEGGSITKPVLADLTAMVALTDIDPDTQELYLNCGAVLISKSTVLTTAACINDSLLNGNGSLSENMRGRVGSNSWKEGGTEIQFDSFLKHPKYDPNSFIYDMGLLFTTAPVKLSTSIRPLKIDFSDVGTGLRGIVAGWGRKNGTNPDDLQQLQMTTVDEDKCVTDVAKSADENNILYPPVDPTTQICAFNSIDRGVCFGDAGGPLIDLEKQALVGLISWGIPCAKGVPDIFTRLSIGQDWLNENIKK